MHAPINRLIIILPFIMAIALPVAGQTVPISQTIQCEDFTDTFGVSFPAITFKSQDPRTALRHCGGGDWIRFDSINLLDGGYDTVRLYYWCDFGYNPSGSQVRLRLDSPAGTAIASFSNIQVWGGFGFDTARTVVARLTGAAGVHNLYLTFEGGTNICDVDKFVLSGRVAIQASDAKTYYVDAAHGSDASNDGLSLDHAFGTIRKAASIMKPGSSCKIRAGIYRETVKPLYTGLAGAPMSFEAYNGENVVISGADPVTGWTQLSGSIFKAPMRWSIGKYFNQVLVDGKMAWVARTPNVEDTYVPDPGDWNLPWCSGAAGVYDTRPWRGKTDPITIASKICIGDNGTNSRRDGNFGAFDMAITQNSAQGNYSIPSVFFNRPANFFAGGLVSLHNYHWSDIGEITSSTSTASKTIINAMAWNSVVTDFNGPGWISHVFGLLDSPNEWFLRNDTLYLWAPDGGDPSHHLVEAKRRTLGFDLRGKQYVTVKGLRFLAASMTLAEASNCVIDGCHFKYVSHADVYDWYETGAGYYQCPFDPTTGYAGVYIGGHDNIFKNGSVTVSARSGIVLSGKNNTVTNSIIRDCDYTVSYQAGILITKRYVNDPNEAIGLTISHTTLACCARGNVQIAWAAHGTSSMDPNRLRVMYNDFGPAAFTTLETASLACQASRFAEVGYNWFHGTAGLTSYDFMTEYDFGAQHYTVHHNVFWQGPSIVPGYKVGSHWTFDWNDTGTSAQAPNTGGSMLFNNTVIDTSDLLHRDWDTQWPGFKRNNIIANSDTAPWKFADPRNRDYSLTALSTMAIDKGIEIAGWVGPGDYVGAAPDLGAYEFGKPRWTAGADWQEQAWRYPPDSNAAMGRIAFGPDAAAQAYLRIVPGRIVIRAPKHAGARITMHDARGAVVAISGMSSAGSSELSTGGVPAGVYVIRILSAGSAITWKALIR